MENKQKALEMAAAMQQKEKSGSLLWCVAEDLKATIQSMNEEEAKVIVADLEAGALPVQRYGWQLAEPGHVGTARKTGR